MPPPNVTVADIEVEVQAVLDAFEADPDAGPALASYIVAILEGTLAVIAGGGRDPISLATAALRVGTITGRTMNEVLAGP